MKKHFFAEMIKLNFPFESNIPSKNLNFISIRQKERQFDCQRRIGSLADKISYRESNPFSLLHFVRNLCSCLLQTNNPRLPNLLRMFAYFGSMRPLKASIDIYYLSKYNVQKGGFPLCSVHIAAPRFMTMISIVKNAEKASTRRQVLLSRKDSLRICRVT